MTKNNIWQKLPKPFFVLAPMDDVTDRVFRQVLVRIGKPDLFFTEFTNVDGLASEKGRKPLMDRLVFDEIEKPIIAQIWGKKPENYYKIAKELVEMGYDGIDINMGCPVVDVVRNGNCSALINNQPLAKEIIQATQEGAVGVPVSVKTRIGFKEIQIEEWLGFLLSLNLDALTVHGRTVKEMSKVPAHWDEIAKVVKLKNQINPQTIIIGNGDVKNRIDGTRLAEQSGVDGIMIGRGIFENLWAFNPSYQEGSPDIQAKLKILVEHTKLFEKTWTSKKNFAILRKFYKAYVRDFNGATELRVKLMETNTPEEVYKIINSLDQQSLSSEKLI